MPTISTPRKTSPSPSEIDVETSPAADVSHATSMSCAPSADVSVSSRSGPTVQMTVTRNAVTIATVAPNVVAAAATPARPTEPQQPVHQRQQRRGDDDGEDDRHDDHRHGHDDPDAEHDEAHAHQAAPADLGQPIEPDGTAHVGPPGRVAAATAGPMSSVSRIGRVIVSGNRVTGTTVISPNTPNSAAAGGDREQDERRMHVAPVPDGRVAEQAGLGHGGRGEARP